MIVPIRRPLPLGAPPSASLRRWLLSTGSLTAALRRLADGQLAVDLHGQYLRPLRPQERRLWPVHAGSRSVLVRQVTLRGQGEAWIEACSLLPTRALRAWARPLRDLGNRPLGARLFRFRHLRRSAPQAYRSAAGHWQRHSFFAPGSGCPILVAETFLPALQRRIEESLS